MLSTMVMIDEKPGHVVISWNDDWVFYLERRGCVSQTTTNSENAFSIQKGVQSGYDVFGHLELIVSDSRTFALWETIFIAL